MTTQKQIEHTKGLISDVQKEIVTMIKKLDLTDEQVIELFVKISMGMSISVTLGRLEHQLDLETESDKIINEIINK